MPLWIIEEGSMKKVISIVLLLAVALSFVSCSASGDGLLGAVTLKLKDTQKCKDCSIKFSTSNDMSASYYITPSGFDMDELDKKGYNMRITVTYDVYYKKDWDLLIGYLGSPKYEVSVVNSDGMGKIDKDLSTSTSSQTRTFSVSASVADLKNTRLILTFSTDNIQNIIYFKNITVDYQCYK